MKVVKVILISLVLLLNFFIFRSRLEDSFNSMQGKNLVGEVKMGRRWRNFDKLRTEAVEYSGWSEEDKIDLSLDPQTQGLVVYEFTRPPGAQVAVLQLSLTHPDPGSNKVSISTNQQDWEMLVENNRFQHFAPPLDLNQYIANSEHFWIKIEATNKEVNGLPAVILYDFHLMHYQREIKMPPLILLGLFTFFPILFIIRPKKKIAIEFLIVFAVIFLGMHLSWKSLFENRYRAFDSDINCLTSQTEKFLSQDLTTALAGNYCLNKESLNVLIILTFWQLFGYGSEMAIKLSSLVFHWLTIGLTYTYGKKIGSVVGAAAAAVFIAVHPYLIDLSTRGLRDPAFTFVILIFSFWLFESNLKKNRNKVILVLAIIFAIYLRLHSIVQLIGLALIFMIARKKLKSGMVIMLTTFLIAAPIIITNLKTYNTWNYSEANHLKWNVNVEFSGQPGFPTKEEERMNPFQGPEISAFTYFFKLHTLPDLIISTLAGVRKTFGGLYFKDNLTGLVLFIAGAWLMLRRKALRYIPVLVFFLEIPHFFLTAKNLVEYRSMTQSLPFIGLTIGYIIDRLWQKLKRF
ncbi:MAG: hypothetical protein UX85_C0002G0095 [Candidatus Beckwithbacteria bacterium GW2011_GWB1_47_15]|uniref:Uncharacterized protein n=1 Tax=Candidatus Beckwithbacteria bacterium GW2011_GWB1_47_15 TaxID=1618371 RepID=A0A0G1UVI8_9BACT|nr:MAG: hypothetical protein UY43_C0001G0683 [Candidatus Beckwithbacteria bacterium GW2011_GWC1_49_16]KKU35661.1 MAG: hypothetical protein UX50_C0002G0088 [Candidatus Beckwithbacteria bacterium GW2011_GWA1_46_30]KKU61715.1 MAG: hypothetical protein UX85_C0002G0095 [Candidatus Beckwithbacteria bacterium GW2011_GWB1_47_15]KKU72219.1 MAG: hypothetical protein UX97_C0001G0089 [Candidatus Beckwithbacteria bacterium GW2011_GWA2_47_25]KKW05020.1 MAG: hypothetical protein UY37_C0001G0124 [Candidatus Be